MTKKTLANIVNQVSLYWDRAERILLLVTFLCTVIGTSYSVSTARRALQESQLSLRPWVAIPDVDTFFKGDRMETRFRVVNIGKVPAYVTWELEGQYNGKRITVAEDKQPPPMPWPSCRGKPFGNPVCSLRASCIEESFLATSMEN